MPHRRLSAADDPLIGQTFARRYEIRARLGSGGMAVVYAGHDKMLMRDVAVKILRPEASGDPTAAKRLQREATAAGQLHHPNIITFHDVGVAGDQLFIVMELLRGGTLSDVRERAGGALTVLRPAQVGAQVSAALRCVHGANIVHRDLKPENIFVLDRGGEEDVKLLDFSIAKLPEELVDGRLTQTGTVFGTPYYMAPEQAMGDPVSFHTDLYSLGAVLFEVVAGRPPFVADNPIKLLAKQSLEAAPTLRSLVPEVPRALDELVQAMLEKEPWHRPASAEEVERALRKVAETEAKGGARERAKAKRKLAGKADKTIQGHFSDEGVGGPVRSPSAVFRRVSAQHEKPAPKPQRQRRSTVPRATQMDVEPTPPPMPANPRAQRSSPSAPPPPTSRQTQPRATISGGRRKRATMPSWRTDPRPGRDEDRTIDEDDTI